MNIEQGILNTEVKKNLHSTELSGGIIISNCANINDTNLF